MCTLQVCTVCTAIWGAGHVTVQKKKRGMRWSHPALFHSRRLSWKIHGRAQTLFESGFELNLVLGSFKGSYLKEFASID